MSDFFLGLLLRLLPAKILGLSTAAIIAALPQIKEAYSAVKGVVDALRAAGHSDATAAKIAFDMIANNKRDKSTIESDAWANRGLQSGQ